MGRRLRRRQPPQGIPGSLDMLYPVVRSPGDTWSCLEASVAVTVTVGSAPGIEGWRCFLLPVPAALPALHVSLSIVPEGPLWTRRGDGQGFGFPAFPWEWGSQEQSVGSLFLPGHQHQIPELPTTQWVPWPRSPPGALRGRYTKVARQLLSARPPATSASPASVS